jgi:hypothetical protein
MRYPKNVAAGRGPARRVQCASPDEISLASLTTHAVFVINSKESLADRHRLDSHRPANQTRRLSQLKATDIECRTKIYFCPKRLEIFSTRLKSGFIGHWPAALTIPDREESPAIFARVAK